MFINISNHPSHTWSEEQKRAALEFASGPIVDIPFPAVPPEADETAIGILAREIIDKIGSLPITDGPSAVMVMGEYSLFWQIVSKLRYLVPGLPVVVATTQRIAEEKDGVKVSRFEFVRFRRLE